MGEIIITIIATIIAIPLVIWIFMKFTGVAFKMLLYIFVEIPVGFCLLICGLIFCFTIILFPFGKNLMKIGMALVLPG